MAQTTTRLIERKSRGASTIGRRSDSPRANTGCGHVIGVDIGGSNLRIALADRNGTVLSKWSSSTRKGASPEMAIEQICAGRSTCCGTLPCPGARCWRLPLAVPALQMGMRVSSLQRPI